MKLELSKYLSIYRFNVKVKYNDFLKINHIKMKNIRRSDDYIFFNTNKMGIIKINSIDLEGIIIIDIYKKIFKLIFIKHLPVTLSLVLIFTIFLISGSYVRDICFDNEADYNYEVYESVRSHLVKKGIYYKLDINLNDLNRTLRNTYQQYAYIGVKKSGSKIIIELSNYETPIIDNDSLNDPGDIISKYDSYIVGIESKKGVVLVTTSQSVKKGDLLISGNINYKFNINDYSKLVKANGIILGEVAEYISYDIKKEQLGYVYSSKITKYYELSLFNKIIETKKVNLNDGYKKKQTFINFFNFLKVNKVNAYSKEETLIKYNQDDALKYAKSKVYYDFNIERISDKECVKEINTLKIDETDEKFTIFFLVKSIRNIGEFIKYEKK